MATLHAVLAGGRSVGLFLALHAKPARAKKAHRTTLLLGEALKKPLARQTPHRVPRSRPITQAAGNSLGILIVPDNSRICPGRCVRRNAERGFTKRPFGA